MGKKTKEKILEAAKRAFAKKGFNGVSVEEIASMAGVNKAVVFYYFPKKEDLFAAVWESSIDELEEHIFKDVEGESLYIRKIKKLLRSYIDFVRNRKEIMKLIEREKASVLDSDEENDKIRLKLKNRYRSFVGRIISLLNEAKRRKEVDSDLPSKEVAGIITDSIGSMVFHPDVSPEMIEKVVLRFLGRR
ncbi:MAG: TetR/AcrR family transcriptional regulator [Thermotoga sp.]|nr:MAG: TetR/AcrR family transcriptional regulator [Thermotoga sp.]